MPKKQNGRIERFETYNLMSLTPDGPIYYARALGDKAYFTRPLDDLMRVIELRVLKRQGLRVQLVIQKKQAG